jgi:hypothetical protein
MLTLTLTDWQEYMLLDIYGYFEKTDYKEVAMEITALSALETGWYKAPVHEEFHNVFSIKEKDPEKQDKRCAKRPIYCMKKYKDYKEGYADALAYFKRLKYPTYRKGFLARMDGVGGKKYAEDKDHVSKVKKITRMIRRVFEEDK